MESLVQDVRVAFRTLLAARGFSIVAVATLALGIGANTTVFSIVNTLLLKPLPYAHPEQLVKVWGAIRQDDIPQNWIAEPRYLGPARPAHEGLEHRRVLHGRRREPHARRRRTGARDGDTRFRDAAAHAGHHTSAGPHVRGGRGCAGPRPCCRARLCLLAGTTGRRPPDRRPDDPAEWQRVHRHRRPAQGISLRRRRRPLASPRARPRQSREPRESLSGGRRAARTGRHARAVEPRTARHRFRARHAVPAELPEGQRLRPVRERPARGHRRRRPASAGGRLRRGRLRAAHRLHQPREPAARARLVAPPGIRGPRGARRGRFPAGASRPDGSRARLHGRRGLRTAARGLGNRRRPRIRGPRAAEHGHHRPRREGTRVRPGGIRLDGNRLRPSSRSSCVAGSGDTRVERRGTRLFGERRAWPPARSGRGGNRVRGRAPGRVRAAGAEHDPAARGESRLRSAARAHGTGLASADAIPRHSGGQRVLRQARAAAAGAAGRHRRGDDVVAADERTERVRVHVHRPHGRPGTADPPAVPEAVFRSRPAHGHAGLLHGDAHPSAAWPAVHSRGHGDGVAGGDRGRGVRPQDVARPRSDWRTDFDERRAERDAARPPVADRRRGRRARAPHGARPARTRADVTCRLPRRRSRFGTCT